MARMSPLSSRTVISRPFFTATVFSTALPATAPTRPPTMPVRIEPRPAADRAAGHRAERAAADRAQAARLAVVRADLHAAHAFDRGHAYRLFALRLRRRVDVRRTAVIGAARHRHELTSAAVSTIRLMFLIPLLHSLRQAAYPNACLKRSFDFGARRRVSLRSLMLDFQRTHQAGKTTGLRPAKLVFDAVQQAAAERVAATGRIDDLSAPSRRNFLDAALRDESARLVRRA